MCCLLDGIASYHADPMTHLVVMLCRESLRLALTDCGLAQVRSDPSVVMPYDKMFRAQLTTVQDARDSAGRDGDVAHVRDVWLDDADGRQRVRV